MILWVMVGLQFLAWGWFSFRGGVLSDKNFLIFTAGLLLGQFASGIETYRADAMRAFVSQLYFFSFTAFGGIRRYQQMRKNKATK